MLAGTVEAERLPVDQEVGALHPDFPDSEGQFIQVFPEGNPGGIQVRRPRPRFPQTGLRNTQHPFPALAPGRCPSLRVQDLNPDRRFPARGFHAEAHRSVRGGNQGDVPDICFRRRCQPHRPLNPGIVEKVKGRAVDSPFLLQPFAGFHRRNSGIVGTEKGGFPFCPHRQGTVADPVVRLHSQFCRFSRCQQAVQFYLKGQKSAPVCSNFPAVQQDPGAVSHRVKAQAYAHAPPSGGNSDLPAVFHGSGPVPVIRIRVLIVVGGGHRNGFPSFIPPETEIPDSAQVQRHPGGVVLRIQRVHDPSPSFPASAP